MNFKQSRRNRRLDSWLIVMLLSVFVISVNFIIQRTTLTIDLSPEKRFSLSRESLALLDKMEDSVDIVFTIKNDNDLPKIIQKLLLDLDILLRNFQNASTRHSIKIHRFDPDSPRDQFGPLGKHNITEDNAVILFSSKGKRKTIFQYESKESTNPYDLTEAFQSKDAHARQAIWQSDFYQDWKETGRGILEPNYFRGEQVLVESLLEVAGPSKEKNVVYFTRGHGEASPTDFDSQNGFSEFRRLVEESNLQVTTIDLSLVDSIPANAKFIVIAHPKGIFLDKEVANIRNYVRQNNGSVLVCIDPVNEISAIDRPAFGLRPLLKEWGLRCHDMLVYDSNPQNYDYFSGAYYLSTYPTSRPHRIIRPLMEKEFRIFGSRCRPVESVRLEELEFISSELLYSSRKSWALSGWANRKMPPEKNELLDIDGPIPVVAISEAKSKNAKSKIAVLGCSEILSNRNLKRNSGNKYICRNLLRWLNENDDFLNIPPSESKNYSISMTDQDFDKMSYLSALVPAFVVLMGVFVSWLRKEVS